ncbi:PREDICTED: cucumber peeling [Prunus dulcis]|uniref:PREDICTED: cucumber peeling n=2 Tax=Prunus dulcis TaxID=3755 RepID=A0A5E4GFQ5_PRUDU|nr:cucumber peeling cupredoxin-like [Prunus dulcis]VVA38594.1 PREDICTED: cucumber peeling [Prunus dulcis]
MAVQREFCIILAVMVVVLVVPSYGCSQNGSGGLRYSVGDTFWAIPPIVGYYSNWSSNHFFKIGDSLVFDFEAGRFNVLQVTKKEYDSCTAYKPLKVFNSGPVNIPLREKGVFYYMCNISNYCSLGQKISIAVNECPCATPSPSPPSPPRASPPPVPPSSSPHIPALPPSPDNSQPPYVQVTSPAPSTVDNGSPQGPSNSAALTHKGVLLGWLSQLVLLLVFVLV